MPNCGIQEPRSNSITTASKIRVPWVLAVHLDCSAKVDSAASRTTTVKSVPGLSMSTVGVNGIGVFTALTRWFDLRVGGQSAESVLSSKETG